MKVLMLYYLCWRSVSETLFFGSCSCASISFTLSEILLKPEKKDIFLYY